MSLVKTQAPLKRVPKNVVKQDVTMATIKAMAERVKNWGKWGTDDELGTLNYVGPAVRLQAAALVKKGISYSLGLNFDQEGPQRTGWGGRFNPIHTMLATGTDAVAGRHDKAGLRYADDMCAQAGCAQSASRARCAARSCPRCRLSVKRFRATR